MNLFKKQPIQSSMLVVALLSVMFGTQCAVLASETQDPGGGGGMPASFYYGFNSAQAGDRLFAGDPLAADAYIVGRCTAHYSKASDVNECEYGAEVAG